MQRHPEESTAHTGGQGSWGLGRVYVMCVRSGFCGNDIGHAGKEPTGGVLMYATVVLARVMYVTIAIQ